MSIKYLQLTPAECFNECQDLLISDTPTFFSLLEKHINLSDFIPSLKINFKLNTSFLFIFAIYATFSSCNASFSSSSRGIIYLPVYPKMTISAMLAHKVNRYGAYSYHWRLKVLSITATPPDQGTIIPQLDIPPHIVRERFNVLIPFFL